MLKSKLYELELSKEETESKNKDQKKEKLVGVIKSDHTSCSLIQWLRITELN